MIDGVIEKWRFTVEHAVGHSTTGGDGESVLVSVERRAVRTGVLVKERGERGNTGPLFDNLNKQQISGWIERITMSQRLYVVSEARRDYDSLHYISFTDANTFQIQAFTCKRCDQLKNRIFLID